MNPATWATVDSFFEESLVKEDAALRAVLTEATAAGLPNIHISPCHAKLLHLLARMSGARRVLEIGTLAGYSTIWLARALPADGRVITLEIDPRHAEIAQRNFERAGVAKKVELHLGRAVETLPKLKGPFDLFFIDADKPSNPDYLQWALTLSRPGSVIAVDNVVRSGAVIDPASQDASVQGTRQVVEMVAREPRLIATAMQTVGCKGYDGLMVAAVQ